MPLTYLQIGSWNIEHLSKEGGRKESPYALTDHIEMAGIEILALQEIYDTSPSGGERRNRELTKVCKLLKEHSGHSWEYELFPNRSEGDTSQLCGVLWNASLMRKSSAYKIEVKYKVDNFKLWDRAPHAVKFSVEYGDATKSVILVPLHMKSNYSGAGHAKRVRHREAIQLASQLEMIQDHFGGDPSLILIGDTNVLDANEKAVEAFEDNGLVDLNAGDAATYPGYGGSPFDRAFVAADRPEFKYTRQYILQSSDMSLHDKYLSDHYMIKISVKLYVDEDDPREFG
jgi:endonuclease/exonuclease/phosphatase family metal-dependent hydrolase